MLNRSSFYDELRWSNLLQCIRSIIKICCKKRRNGRESGKVTMEKRLSNEEEGI